MKATVRRDSSVTYILNALKYPSVGGSHVSFMVSESKCFTIKLETGRGSEHTNIGNIFPRNVGYG